MIVNCTQSLNETNPCYDPATDSINLDYPNITGCNTAAGTVSPWLLLAVGVAAIAVLKRKGGK